MLLNHEGLTVQDATARAGAVSLCPECQRPLLAKRGQFKIWHWAHKANTDPPCTYSAGETQWHLCWKAAFANRAWRVEVGHEIERHDGSKSRFVFDAAIVESGRVTRAYEFVHTLSEHYAPKGQAVTASGIQLTWVFDGKALARSNRALIGTGSGPTRSYSYRKLLKDKAFAVSQSLAGNVLVHQLGGLWCHLANNSWYPIIRPEQTEPADLAKQYTLLDPEQLKAAFTR